MAGRCDFINHHLSTINHSAERNFHFAVVFSPCHRYTEAMKQNRMTLLACVLSGAIVGTQIAAAISADNPYLTTITNRNLFRLTAPPDPALLIPVVAPPPLPEVKLAGITTLMGKTLAILRVPRAAKPPDRRDCSAPAACVTPTRRAPSMRPRNAWVR